MQRHVLLSACVLACAGFLPVAALSDGTATAPSGTPPPQIYRIVTTALCSRLHETVRPAVAMVLQNDQKIAKSPPLFARYRRAMLDTGSDSINVSTPETDMTLQQMSYLVSPTARNLISAQTLLDDPKLTSPTGNSADDATLALIRKQLLETVAFQSAALDIINGFVQTQQLGELQHIGTDYIAAIQTSDSTAQIAQEHPNQFQDPNAPGIPENPYAFDVSQIPGLAVGYNPITRLLEGLQWLKTETSKREDAAGKTIGAALNQCGK